MFVGDEIDSIDFLERVTPLVHLVGMDTVKSLINKGLINKGLTNGAAIWTS